MGQAAAFTAAYFVLTHADGRRLPGSEPLQVKQVLATDDTTTYATAALIFCRWLDLL